jgi:hypothetical protein
MKYAKFPYSLVLLGVCVSNIINIVVVFICLYDLQCPVQSVPTASKVVSSNPVPGKISSIQHYEIMVQVMLRSYQTINQVFATLRIKSKDWLALSVDNVF